MNIRLILIIIILVLGIVFVGFNIKNTTDISLIFSSMDNVPTGIALLIAVSSGLLVGFIGGSLERVIKKSKKPKTKDTENQVVANVKPSKKRGKSKKAPQIDEVDATVHFDSPEMGSEPMSRPPVKKKRGFWKKKDS